MTDVEQVFTYLETKKHIYWIVYSHPAGDGV